MLPYLCLLSESVPQRKHGLRSVFNGLRSVARSGSQRLCMALPTARLATVVHRLPADATLASSGRVRDDGA